MLSKIKSSTAIETRSAASQHQQQQQQQRERENEVSDTEDDLTIDNDTNNNNNSNLNNNNNNNNNPPLGKKNEDELLDIIEVSRKRRLSRSSADSLTDFIKWSFSHMDSPTHHKYINNNNNNNTNNNNNHITSFEKSASAKRTMDKLMGSESPGARETPVASSIDADEDEWATNYSTGTGVSKIEQLYRQHASKMAAAEESACGSSATNLALIRATDRHMLSPNLVSQSGKFQVGNNKRVRTQTYSPEPKFDISGGGQSSRKSAGYLGNVVDRLHQQQQQQQQQQQIQIQQQASGQQELGAGADLDQPSGDLSYHLQQFLQQQTSLEDLCSSVGLDDSNQLVLAAAIHRALVDSMGPAGGNNQQDTKSTASSTGSSSGASSGQQHLAQASSASALSSSSANLHLIDSLSRQRRTYNTRGASMHGLTSAAAAAAAMQQSQRNQQQQQAAARQGLGTSASVAGQLSNRAQQQRHAQAAAALSALASAGSQSGSASNQLGGPLGATSGGTPMVDFECDTCGSSFDDRHRLMQHQSIHLELKKNWFQETPVDEVMKIFNRRRGEFLCNTCNLRFEATFDYDKHNHSVHGQRPYCCQFCGNGTRTFRFWRQYLNHLYDHRYIFSCTIDDCDFTVNRRDSLRFHIFRFHLNCQLPQNQQHLRSSHNMLGLGAEANKWQAMDEDEEDQDNDMNVGE